MQPLFFKSTARTFMQSAHPMWIVTFLSLTPSIQLSARLSQIVVRAFHCFSSHSLQNADSVCWHTRPSHPRLSVLRSLFLRLQAAGFPSLISRPLPVCLLRSAMLFSSDSSTIPLLPPGLFKD